MRDHKMWTLIIIVGIIFVGYKVRAATTGASTAPKYVFAAASKGSLVVSVTASGQVSASNQIDIKPKASGDVVWLPITAGQIVHAGQALVSLDARDAQKSLRDAELGVESAKLSLAKLQEPADSLSTTQSTDAVAEATDAETKSYTDAFAAVENTFIDLPTMMTSLQTMLVGSPTGSGGASDISTYADTLSHYDTNVYSLRDAVLKAYANARTSYDTTFSAYSGLSRASSVDDIKKILNQTSDTATLIAQAIRATSDFLSNAKDQMTSHSVSVPANLTSNLGAVLGYTTTINAHVTALINAENTILSAERTLTEKTAANDKPIAGVDALDIQSAELAVTRAENTLADAQATLNDYTIRAPFDGTIARVAINKYDTVSSGTTIATIITTKKIAEVSLNEVDVSKIKVGEKVTLSFDAIDGLSIAGQVAEVDTIGTTSQGVVTYNVKISFDTQDDRVKSGMSVSAAIITDVKQDVVVVPASAVKSMSGQSYVQEPAALLSPADLAAVGGITLAQAPKNVPVETGLSNDTETEIVSGVNEGDQIVVRTITITKTTTAAAPSLFGAGSSRGGGGGTLRFESGGGGR